MSSQTPATAQTSSLYVGDLHEDIDDQELFQMFFSFGNLFSVRICRDQQTKKSLGYGYVNFSSRADAERAKEALMYSDVKGKQIRISWQERDPTARRANIGNIFIKGLADAVDPKSLHDLVSPFGNIKSLVVRHKDIYAKEGKKRVNYGFVQFETAESAEQAIKLLDGKKIEGIPVSVQHFVRREGRQNPAEKYTNLYIKPIPKEYKQEDLQKLFEKYGKIQNAFVPTKDGESRGFGFCNFFDHESAVLAEKELNGTELQGQKLIVTKQEAKAVREKRMKKIYESKKKDLKSKTKGLNVYVKNLAESINKDKLKSLFSKFGDISSCVVMNDQKTNVSRGFGFCCFNNEQAAQQAINEMNGQLIEGKQLYVALAQSREERKAWIEKQKQFAMNPMGVYQPYQYAGYAPYAQYAQPQYMNKRPYNKHQHQVPVQMQTMAPMAVQMGQEQPQQ